MKKYKVLDSEHIRAADLDYAEAELVVVQFELSETGARRTIIDAGKKLFTFEELDLMVRETYAMWIEECDERARKARHGASGADGTFNFG